MALSPDLSTVTLQGTYVDISGQPISGSVSITATTIIKDEDVDQILINRAIVETLDTNGFFSAVLLATDDTDATPNPFAYQIQENFSGGRTFFITLPASSPSPVDIADIAPAVSLAESANYITTDQYNNLLSRYTTSNNTIIALGQVGTDEADALDAASNATNALATAQKFGINQFLLMGV